MLSKIFDAKNQDHISFDAEKIWDLLEKKNRLQGHSFSRLDTEGEHRGTLGQISFWRLNGVEVVAKTHIPGDMYYDNLMKEYQLMNQIYKDDMFIDVQELDTSYGKQVVLFMEKLNPMNRLPSPDEVQCEIKRVINAMHLDARWSCFKTKDLMRLMVEALGYFKRCGLIDREVSRYIDVTVLPKLNDVLKEPLILSHGDLGNKNIMRKGKSLIFIDWEDAFLSVEGYDFLYWLTFFDQKMYLEKSFFMKYNLYNLRAESLLVCIVLLKSYLSYLDKSYLKHSVSVNDRIKSILSIFHDTI